MSKISNHHSNIKDQVGRSKTVVNTSDHKNQEKMFTYVNNGVIDPYKDIKVDNFYANRKDQFTFFLSHMHEGNINLILL